MLFIYQRIIQRYFTTLKEKKKKLTDIKPKKYTWAYSDNNKTRYLFSFPTHFFPT